MKQLSYLIAITMLAWSMQACNNNPKSKDSVEMAEDANSSEDTTAFRTVPDMGVVDQDTYDDAGFAVKAADAGLTEVQLGKIALTNAMDQTVKDFGQMMVDDHTNANNELMALAKKKDIVLPSVPGEDHVKHIRDLNDKKGNDFDNDYIDMMVKDHKDVINLFERAEKSASDAEIKAFATKTLPVLRKHLTTAESLKKTLDEKK